MLLAAPELPARRTVTTVCPRHLSTPGVCFLVTRLMLQPGLLESRLLAGRGGDTWSIADTADTVAGSRNPVSGRKKLT